MSKKSKIVYSFICIFVAAAMFIGGYFTSLALNSGKYGELSWVINYLQDVYFYGEDYETSDYAKALVDALGDRYSEYYTKEEYAALLNSNAGNNIGLGLAFLTDGKCVIHSVTGNSPAERAGIKAGGKIVAVGGEKVENYQEFSARLLKYAEGVPFDLIVEYSDGSVTYNLQREAFVSNLVTYKDSESEYRFTGKNGDEWTKFGGEGLSVLDDKTAYVKFTNFHGNNTLKNIETCLDYALSEGKRTVVVDLRGNGGGYVDMMSDIVSFFIDEDKGAVTAVASYKDGSNYSFRTAKRRCKGFEKVIVMADENSASASECFINALLDYKIMTFNDLIIQNKELGADGFTRTYGKGIMQTTYVNSATGGALKITTAEIKSPIEGNCIHGVGFIATKDNSVISDEEAMTRLAELIK